MQKWLILAITTLMMTNAHANKSWCGYKDYFRINTISHPDAIIKRGFNDQDVLLQVLGPRSFQIRDSFLQCQAGYAQVIVSDEQGNWCILEIKDGPFMSHPKISPSCNGIRYINTEYDGFNTYSYSINLD